jgi:hypothetical protein
MPRKQPPHQDLAGRYPLSVSVADWDTGGVVEIAGVLHVRRKETTGYEWCWRFEVHDVSQERARASSSCSARTLLRFVEAASANEFVSIPREVVEGALRDVELLREYVDRVLAGEDLDGEQIESELDLKALNSAQERQDAENQKRDEILARKKQEEEALEEIKSAIIERDLNRLLLVCQNIGVNTGFREYTWHGVYTQETPLSLSVAAGWREGALALIREGAATKDVVAATDSRSFTRFHDCSVVAEWK